MLRRLLLLLPCLAFACRSSQSVEGLAPANDTGGPQVVFDIARRPFPEIPFPNDLLTQSDQGSPTGVRLNASVIVPTGLEQRTRALLDQLDGFGTFAPITVSFNADIDLIDLAARQNDADPTNDAVYLVQIDDGSTWPVDLGGGHFPYVLPDPSLYFPNDPFAQHRNLLFPSCGPLANAFTPPGPACDDPDPRKQVDQLVPFYQRSTHTLIIRPVLPLKQEERYAVILTDRLRDGAGRAVMSPGPGINHAGQTGELSPLVGHLPAGVTLDHVAYTWAFTTQSTTRDLEAIDFGLLQQGPFFVVGQQYATSFTSANGMTFTQMVVLPENDAFTLDNPLAYTVPASALVPLFSDPALAPLFGTMDAATANALAETYRYIDYFVSGSYSSPNFIAPPSGPPENGVFQINSFTGEARTQPETVTFLLAVPKRNATHQPPFPTVLLGHEYTSGRAPDLFAFAGTFAKYGVATISIDAPGHGLVLDTAAQAAFMQSLSNAGLSRFATALLTTRARDLDNDGIADSGGDFFTADAFHTRDSVRQSAIDWMMLIRYLRTFDGATKLVQSTGGPNLSILNGDFNNDGVPDVAGPPTWPVQVSDRGIVPNRNFKQGDPNPGSDLFASGQSLGGIVAGVLAAVEPAVVATAPASGGGGLADVAIRSQLKPLVNSIFLGAIGPFFTSCAFDFAQGKCAAGGSPTLVLVVRDLTGERDLPIAPLTLLPGDQLTVTNLSSTSDACARDHSCATVTADASGLARVGVIATGTVYSPQNGAAVVAQPGDRLQVGITRSTGSEPQNINAFGFDSTFFGATFHAGDPLIAPSAGWGYERNTPELRRLMQLWQTVVEPGDPIAYARYWASNPLPLRNGVPLPALVVGTVGDTSVPVATAIALARAAGLVAKVDPTYGRPVDEVLIQAGVVEGMANLQRLADPTTGPLAALAPFLSCAGADCSGDVLVDPTSYSQGTDGLNAPRLNPPLLDQLTLGVRLPDQSLATSALLLPYLSRAGQHGFRSPQPDKSFDVDQFMANLMGRWFETRGRELHFDACQAHEPPDCSWIPRPP
jgi:hypothetical protein